MMLSVLLWMALVSVRQVRVWVSEFFVRSWSCRLLESLEGHMDEGFSSKSTKLSATSFSLRPGKKLIFGHLWNCCQLSKSESMTLGRVNKQTCLCPQMAWLGGMTGNAASTDFMCGPDCVFHGCSQDLGNPFFMVNGYCFKDGAILPRTNLLLPPIEINKAYHSTLTTTAH